MTLADARMEVKQGLAPGSLARVDDHYIPKTQVGTDVFSNVRVFRQSIDLVNPLGSGRKITFAFPNSGLLDLRSVSIIANLTLDAGGLIDSGSAPIKFDDGEGLNPPAQGYVWKWDGTGTDPDPSFPDEVKTRTTYASNINQGLSDPGYFSLIERIVVQAGGTPLVDIRDLNLINHMCMKMRWNKNMLEREMGTYEGFYADNSDRVSGAPYTGYWERNERQAARSSSNPYNLCCSRPQPIVIRPFMFHNALFNTSDGVLPTQFMPNITFEIYFADPGNVLKQQIQPNRKYGGSENASNSGRLHYFLKDVKMEVCMAGSTSLEGALIAEGMSMTWRNYTTFTRELSSSVGLQQFQIPVTQRAVEQVFLIIRRTADLQDITFPGKLSSWWPVQREIVRANIRINGIRRYGEDLDSRGMFLEFRRLYPEAKGSDLFMDEFRDWGSNNQMLVFSAQMDYSQMLISGIKTASQTSPLIVEIQWTDKLDVEVGTQLQVDIVVKHLKWASISREAIEVID